MRHIVWADTEGELHKFEVGVFVVLKTCEALGIDYGLAAEPEVAEQISEMTAEVALHLVQEGWFNLEEWKEAWAKGEVENVDEELKTL